MLPLKVHCFKYFRCPQKVVTHQDTSVFELYAGTNMGHSEIPNTALKPVLLSSSVSFLHIAFFFQRHPRRTEAQVCVCFHAACLWIQAQMRHDKLLHPPLRSSVVGLSALPFSSSFHHSFLFFLHFFFMSQVETRHDWE